MLPILQYCATKLTFGSTANAEMYAVLYDKKNTSVVWRDKAIGRMGGGGLMGMAFSNVMAEGAISKAARSMMDNFPDKFPSKKTKKTGNASTEGVFGGGE